MKKFILIVLAACMVLPLSAQLQKGQAAPAIVLPDTKDSIVSLASFTGKVVVLDFWASWCGPCRASNPKLVKLYNDLKNQGLEVVSVSLDQDKTAWLQAVKKDKLPYTVLIDPSGSRSKVADAYGIFQIPTSYLIDKQGHLREKDLEGKKLKTAITKLLAE